MSAKSSPALIGVFTLGAVALAVGILAVLGAGFFTKKVPVIMYFDGSVTGLDVGSPLIFRGVPVGTVREIRIVADPKSLTLTIPVKAEIRGGKVTTDEAGDPEDRKTLLMESGMTPEQLIQALIKKGLRAQLVSENLLTGQLAVYLDLLPDAPARLRGRGNDVEIPTISSEFEELSKSLKSLPLKELASHLLSAVEGVERLVNSPEATRIPGKMDTALTSGMQLLDDLRLKTDTLTRNLNEAVSHYRDLAGNLDQRTDKLIASARKSLDSLDGALVDGKTALSRFQKVVHPDSPSVVELNKALAEVAQAAKAIRSLADYLERHPEAFIQGKRK